MLNASDLAEKSAANAENGLFFCGYSLRTRPPGPETPSLGKYPSRFKQFQIKCLLIRDQVY
jgi:hypothetical protein